MLCVLIIEGMSVVVNVMVSLMSVMNPPPALCNISVRTEVMYFGFRGELRVEITYILSLADMDVLNNCGLNSCGWCRETRGGGKLRERGVW